MPTCPDCGSFYDDDNDSTWGSCGGCGYNASIEAYERSEARKAHYESIAEEIESKKKSLLGRRGKTKKELWLEKKNGKKIAIESVDRTKFKAAIVFDELIVEDSFCPELDQDDRTPFQSADVFVKQLQAILPRGWRSDQICQCRRITFKSEENCDEYTGITIDRYLSYVLVESNMHENDFDLLKDISTNLIEKVASTLGVSFVKEYRTVRVSFSTPLSGITDPFAEEEYEIGDWSDKDLDRL